MKFKELREKKNLSQADVSKIVNVSQSNYGKYELETIEPNIETLKTIAEFYGVSLDYLCDFNPPYNFNLPSLSVEQKEAINILIQLPLPKFYEILGELKTYQKLYDIKIDK